jgi:hypothetical protein
MPQSPCWKVFDPSGEYVASFKYPEHAAVLVAAFGDGAQLRYLHANKCTFWREGREAQPAGESYDFVAKTVRERRSDWIRRGQP